MESRVSEGGEGSGGGCRRLGVAGFCSGEEISDGDHRWVPPREEFSAELGQGRTVIDLKGVAAGMTETHGACVEEGASSAPIVSGQVDSPDPERNGVVKLLDLTKFAHSLLYITIQHFRIVVHVYSASVPLFWKMDGRNAFQVAGEVCRHEGKCWSLNVLDLEVSGILNTQDISFRIDSAASGLVHLAGIVLGIYGTSLGYQCAELKGAVLIDIALFGDFGVHFFGYLASVCALSFSAVRFLYVDARIFILSLCSGGVLAVHQGLCLFSVPGYTVLISAIHEPAQFGWILTAYSGESGGSLLQFLFACVSLISCRVCILLEFILSRNSIWNLFNSGFPLEAYLAAS